MSAQTHSTTVSNRVALVTVHYRGLEQTGALLESLAHQDQTGVELRVIIVNNSGLGSAEDDAIDGKINSLGLDAHRVTVENKGYFAGLNSGAALLTDWTPTSIIFCNNDIVLDADFMRSLLASKLPRGTRVVYPRLIDNDLGDQNPRAVRAPSKLRLLAYSLYYSNLLVALAIRTAHIAVSRVCPQPTLSQACDSRQALQSRPILFGVGACFLVFPTGANDYFLPEDIFLFGEEALLAEQTISMNKTTWFEATLVARHEAHSTVGLFGFREYWNIQRTSSKVFLKVLRRLSQD